MNIAFPDFKVKLFVVPVCMASDRGSLPPQSPRASSKGERVACSINTLHYTYYQLCVDNVRGSRAVRSACRQLDQD